MVFFKIFLSLNCVVNDIFPKDIKFLNLLFPQHLQFFNFFKIHIFPFNNEKNIIKIILMLTVKIIKPTCVLETVKDGRGGNITWLPDKPILEFNMLYFRPGKTRGFHFHPHFEEYLLVVDGNGTLVTRKIPESKESEEFIHLSKGILY